MTKIKIPNIENMGKLTVDQAYLAVFIFLDDLYKMTKSDDLGGFLGDMAILNDGGPADPAVTEDWLNAVEKARDEKNWDIAEFRIIKE